MKKRTEVTIELEEIVLVTSGFARSGMAWCVGGANEVLMGTPAQAAVIARAPEVDFTVIVSGPITTLSQEAYFSELTGEGADVPRRSRAEIAQLMKAHQPTGFDPIPFIRQMRIPS